VAVGGLHLQQVGEGIDVVAMTGEGAVRGVLSW
jgi:hypothetical protein